MNKVCELIWVQFNDATHWVIKGEEEYDEKAGVYDSVCLLEMAKKISSVVDSKTNKILTFC